MADIHDAMEAEKLAMEHVGLIDEEAPLEKVVALGFIAVAYTIRAVGVRMDYVLRDIAKDLKPFTDRW